MTEVGDGDGGLSSISAGVEHGRARGGMEELRGEVAKLGVRRIEVGRRRLAGATNDGDVARFCSLELDLAQRKENGERNGKLRGRLRSEERRSDAMADAWKLAAVHSRRYGVGAQWRAQWSYCFFV